MNGYHFQLVDTWNNTLPIANIIQVLHCIVVGNLINTVLGHMTKQSMRGSESKGSGSMRLSVLTWFSQIAIVCLFLINSSGFAGATDRVALVIGNANYANTPRLGNSLSDAEAIRNKLEKIGFSVDHYEDLDGQSFRIALGKFTERAVNADLALVFYAGHGIEIEGKNFLIPTDANMDSQATAQFETIKLDDILSSVTQARTLGMVLLDACRDNPFVNTIKRANGTRSISRGLAPLSIEQETGLLVSFAAQAGSTAADGDGKHSPYTSALLNVLDEPGLEVNRIFRKLRQNVVASTNGMQTPIELMQLPDQDVYLVPPQNNSVQLQDSSNNVDRDQPINQDPFVAYLDAVKSRDNNLLKRFIQRWPDHARAENARQILMERTENEFWENAEIQNNIVTYQEYLLIFPEGKYALAAKESLDELQSLQHTMEVGDKNSQSIANQAEEFVRFQVYGSNSNSEEYYRSIYADKVHFYSKEDASQNFIIKDKEKYFKRWPIFEYQYRSGSYSVKSHTYPFLVDAIIIAEFEVQNSEKIISGTVNSFLTLQDNGDGFRIVGEQSKIIESQTTEIPSNEVGACEALDGDWSVVNILENDTLFVRSGPGKQNGVVGELPWNGTGVGNVQCSGSNWCSVTFGCIKGYSFGKYLTNRRAGQRNSQFSGYYRVSNHPQNEFLNVRSGPGTQYQVVGGLSANASGIKVTDCQVEKGYKYHWCTISWGSVNGWAYKKYLTLNNFQQSAKSHSLANKSCNELWHARNRIFADKGYCFRSARGQAAFSNAGCHTKSPNFSAQEKRAISSIKSMEAQKNC
jgi:uncharacterized protein YraI